MPKYLPSANFDDERAESDYRLERFAGRLLLRSGLLCRGLESCCAVDIDSPGSLVFEVLVARPKTGGPWCHRERLTFREVLEHKYWPNLVADMLVRLEFALDAEFSPPQALGPGKGWRPWEYDLVGNIEGDDDAS